MFRNVKTNLPRILWYLGSAAAAGYLKVEYGSWIPAAFIFGIYIVGSLLIDIEYKRGMLEATRIHNEAMERIITEQKEWLAEFQFDTHPVPITP